MSWSCEGIISYGKERWLRFKQYGEPKKDIRQKDFLEMIKAYNKFKEGKKY